MKRFKLFFPLVCMSLLSVPHTAFAAEDDQEMGYDSIVNELSRLKSHKTTENLEEEDPLSAVQIHVGVGMANSYFAIQQQNGYLTQANQKGVQASLGIDLFSPHWIAEGSVISFMEHDYEHGQMDLKEFDLKLYYQNNIDELITFKIGGGLAARYLNIHEQIYSNVPALDDKGQPKKDSNGKQIYTQQLGPLEESYVTPFSILATGFDIRLTRKLTVGGEVAARYALTDETPDLNAIDFTVRIDAHF